MSMLQNSVRRMTPACLLLGMLLLTGCHQLSKTTRTERVHDSEAQPHSPTTGPSLGPESSELQPVPVQTPSLLLPPPAPPSDSARRQKTSADSAAEFGWDDESLDEAEQDAAEEFFPSSASDLAREVLTHRVAASQARLAEAGRAATVRRAAQANQLPLIVPAKPKLQRVSSKDLVLMPVPR